MIRSTVPVGFTEQQEFFLPFFSEKVIEGRLIDFLSVDFTDENSYIISCRKIIESIITYEEHKRKREPYESDIFYNNIAETILTELKKSHLRIRSLR